MGTYSMSILSLRPLLIITFSIRLGQCTRYQYISARLPTQFVSLRSCREGHRERVCEMPKRK